MIKCSVCGEWFEPYQPVCQMYTGEEDEPMCYDCKQIISEAIYEKEKQEECDGE